MGTLLSFFTKLLGLGAGQSVGSFVGGVANHAIWLSLIGWLISHANDQIKFSTSLGFVAIIAAFCYVILEIVRRRNGGGGG